MDSGTYKNKEFAHAAHSIGVSEYHLQWVTKYRYETLSKWIPEKHSSTLITFYVGKIEFDGRFVEPIRRTGLTKGARNLDEYIKRLDGASRDEWKLLNSTFSVVIFHKFGMTPNLNYLLPPHCQLLP
jgi:hypothetical protein